MNVSCVKSVYGGGRKIWVVGKPFLERGIVRGWTVLCVDGSWRLNGRDYGAVERCAGRYISIISTNSYTCTDIPQCTESR